MKIRHFDHFLIFTAEVFKISESSGMKVILHGES